MDHLKGSKTFSVTKTIDELDCQAAGLVHTNTMNEAAVFVVTNIDRIDDPKHLADLPDTTN